MGRHELETALRREGDQQVRQLWQQLEAEADLLRRQNAAVLEREQQATKARLDAETAVILGTARAVAMQQAQRTRLFAEEQLVERLKSQAQPLLEKMATEGGQALFLALAAEIPAHDWHKITVHARDAGAAKDQYPGAEVISSAQISGGLQTEDAEGRVMICNSLEKRLEHLWPELLPEMLREIRQRLEDQ